MVRQLKLEIVAARLTTPERRLIEAAAGEAQTTVSEFVREVVTRAARRAVAERDAQRVPAA